MSEIRVLESFLCAKTGEQDDGDDAVIVTSHFAAVLDGATDSLGVTYDGIGAARSVVEAGLRAIQGLAPDITAHEAVAALTLAVRQALRIPPDKTSWRPPCFVFVIYSASRREIWRVGDAQYLIDGIGENLGMVVDQVTTNVRRMVLHAYLARGATIEDLRREDPGHEAAMPLFVLQTQFMNRTGSPFSHGAINGNNVPMELIEIFSVPSEASEIVLASDGYPEVYPSLRESETWLQHVLEQDPLLINLHIASKAWRPGAASFDDRAYLRLNVSSAINP